MVETQLSSEELIKTWKDLLIFTNPSVDVDIEHNLSELPEYVDQTISQYGGIWYVTGGFQGTYSHFHLLCNYEDSLIPYNYQYMPTYPVLLGLEPDEYIKRKGRDPIIPLDKRIKFWIHCLRDHSRIFVVPSDTQDYDQLAMTVGVYKKEGVYHIGDRDDPNYIKEARMNRSHPGYYLGLHMWDQHTSDFK